MQELRFPAAFISKNALLVGMHNKISVEFYVKLLKIETIYVIIGYPLKQYTANVTRKFN